MWRQKVSEGPWAMQVCTPPCHVCLTFAHVILSLLLCVLGKKHLDQLNGMFFI